MSCEPTSPFFWDTLYIYAQSMSYNMFLSSPTGLKYQVSRHLNEDGISCNCKVTTGLFDKKNFLKTQIIEYEEGLRD